ncbi:MAG: hypothetical protein ACLGI6_04150 [Gammaproteobacteria bacterium]
MITIEHLEVQFDVAGEQDGDEAVFARYFSRYIAQWARAEQQQAALRERQRSEEQQLKERLRRDQRLGQDGSYS